MLRTRIISATMGIVILVGFLLLHRLAFAFLVTVIVLLGLDEYYSLLRFKEMNPNSILGIGSGFILCLGALLWGQPGLLGALILTLLVGLIWRLFDGSRLADCGLTLLGSYYIGGLFSYLILLRDLPHGIAVVLTIFLGTWAYDIAAYAGGAALGKNKLFPQVSPNKTIEGAICGSIASTLTIALLFLLPWLPFAGQSWAVALLKGFFLGFLIGIAAPLGDLVESQFKREIGVKDTSSLIPGHGGILDRFDGLLFTGVVGFYIFTLYFVW